MNGILIFTIIAMLVFSIEIIAQIAPNNFQFSSRTALDTTYQINGYGSSYSTSTNYTMVFGYSSAGIKSNDVLLTKFDVTGKTYSPITLANGVFCIDKTSAGFLVNDIIEAYNSNGILVKSLKVNSSDCKISLKEFCKGMYVINVISSNTNYFKKVFVE